MLPPQRKQFLLTGDPGCGKTYTVNTIVLATDLLQLGHIVACAYMGIAAVLIKGYTLCKLFFVDFGKKKSKHRLNGGYIHPLSSEELKILQDKLQYKNLSMLVIDEISTVDHLALAVVNARLQQV